MLRSKPVHMPCCDFPKTRGMHRVVLHRGGDPSTGLSSPSHQARRSSLTLGAARSETVSRPHIAGSCPHVAGRRRNPARFRTSGAPRRPCVSARGPRTSYSCPSRRLRQPSKYYTSGRSHVHRMIPPTTCIVSLGDVEPSKLTSPLASRMNIRLSLRRSRQTYACVFARRNLLIFESRCFFTCHQIRPVRHAMRARVCSQAVTRTNSRRCTAAAITLLTLLLRHCLTTDGPPRSRQAATTRICITNSCGSPCHDPEERQ